MDRWKERKGKGRWMEGGSKGGKMNIESHQEKIHKKKYISMCQKGQIVPHYFLCFKQTIAMFFDSCFSLAYK